jgi:hypothetical protein
MAESLLDSLIDFVDEFVVVQSEFGGYSACPELCFFTIKDLIQL